MAYDSAHDRVVMFGGQFFLVGVPAFNDTWLWDGSNWTEKSPSNSPSPRFDHAMAYDSAHGQVVMFGGVDGNANVFPNPLNEIWLWDGSDWAQKRPATAHHVRQQSYPLLVPHAGCLSYSGHG